LIESIIESYYVQRPYFAMILHGMGGMGKSAIATEVFAHFQANEQQKYVFCRIQLSLEADEDEICKMQKKMLDNFSSLRTDRGKEPYSLGEGLVMLKEALEEMKGRGKPVFLYVDNLERTYGENWMPEIKSFPEGSKVLVTSRNKFTCMDLVTQQLKLGTEGTSEAGSSYEFIEVGKLEKEEARELLWRHVGRPREQEVGEMEEKVLGKCDGLPLALKVVGSHIGVEYELMQEYGNTQALKNKEKEVWANVVRNMEKAEPLDGGREDKLYHRLRFSIDSLDADLKSAFFDLLDIAIISPYFLRSAFLEHFLGTDKMMKLHRRALVSLPPTAEYGQMPVVHDVMRNLVTRMMRDAGDEIRIYWHKLSNPVSLSFLSIFSPKSMLSLFLRFTKSMRALWEIFNNLLSCL
jgi:shikimate kinase